MKKIALYGGTFSPPGEHHRAIAIQLTKEFDEVIIVPCGPRPDKPIVNDVEPQYRAAMSDMAFGGITKVIVDLFDLEETQFTRTHLLERRFASRGELWHAVGAELIKDGEKGKSIIHKEWEHGSDLWKTANFIILKREHAVIEKKDLPPKHKIVEVPTDISSTIIREKLFKRESIEGLIPKQVACYIERHALYRGTRPSRTTGYQVEELKPAIIIDDQNPEANRIAKGLKFKNHSNPNLIVGIGGDGFMLRVIREHWRKRIPFYGINAGRLGFLLNESAEALSTEKFLALHQLPLLWIETENSQGQKMGGLAFNDAWVERATGQTAWIKVEINDKERLQLLADAALVSTAAGSASYARAMGAQPLPFNTPALLLVGSNVLKPYGWKCAVLPLDTVVKLTGLDPTKRPLHGYVDGVSRGNVNSMKIRLSNTASVELLFDPAHDPAEKLAKIQFPTVSP
jgi:nicotinate (nicotinamide) nucleotide adenylyltransferase